VSISKSLLGVIPSGEENAVTGRHLWKKLGMWSLASIKQSLNEMADQGSVERSALLEKLGRQICILGGSRLPMGVDLGLKVKK
jgi:hypothetical protein